MTTGTMLVYGGIAGLCVTAAAAIISIVVFSSSRRRLQKKLDEEYGKRDR